jgi:ubiquinone/menaquinone biosynthesis C-methylase UbiE
MTIGSGCPAAADTFDYNEYQDHLGLVLSYGPTALFRDRIIRKLTSELRGLRILDLGCGTGHVTLMFERANHVVSMDPALEGVAITRRRRRAPGGCVVGGGEALPFADGSFDCVLLLDVLEHIDGDVDTAREAWRVLRPGGCVFCIVPENQRLFSRIDEANGHVRRYSRDQLLRVFAAFTPERLFDYGFPLMRVYLKVLARVHDRAVPQREPRGLRRVGLKAVASVLTALFSFDLLFAGSFRGVELVALFRKKK